MKNLKYFFLENLNEAKTNEFDINNYLFVEPNENDLYEIDTKLFGERFVDYDRLKHKVPFILATIDEINDLIKNINYSKDLISEIKTKKKYKKLEDFIADYDNDKGDIKFIDVTDKFL